jgi:GntR family transcriptional regulator of vanillate catabolism
MAPTRELQPLERVRLVDEVTRQLRDLIISGQLPPGTPLLQTELARELGVSRTPLREAFRLLEYDGLVRISNGNRTIEVVRITADELEEMYQIREVIDGLAARLAAKNGISDEVRDTLLALLAEMEETAHSYDPGRRVDVHARFHSLIAESCGNKRLGSFLQLIRVSSAALFIPYVTDPSHASLTLDDGQLLTQEVAMEGAHQQHREIFTAIVAGDAREAEAAARRHIRRTLKGVRRLDEWSGG